MLALSLASMERRRSCAAAGRLPPALAAQFTLAEQAVLAVVAVEVAKKGQCTLTIGHLAALASVSETTGRNALREAEALGLISIDRKRRTARVSYPNTVKIVSKEWASWLRLRTGANPWSPRLQESKSSLAQGARTLFQRTSSGNNRTKRNPERVFGIAEADEERAEQDSEAGEQP